MKKTLAIVLALMLCVSALSVVAFAADSVTLYCQAPDDWTGCNVYWWDSSSTNPTWPGNAMTLGSDGIWYAEVPADAAGVIFNNGNGTQTDNLTVPTDDNVMYVYGNKAWTTYGSKVEVVVNYYVVGSMNDWTSSDDYAMTENDGVYSLTVALTAGDYEYKVNNSLGVWYPDGDNLVLTVAEDANITFTYNSETGEVTAAPSVEIPTDPTTPSEDVTTPSEDVTTPSEDVTTPSEDVTTPSEDVTTPSEDVTVPTEPVVKSEYYVAGQAGLCGSEWDPADANNQMIDAGDGLVKITFYSVEAGTYEFKITKGSWTDNWGAEGYNSQNNCTVTVEATSNVTITFNPETEEITAEVTDPTDAPATEAPSVTEPTEVGTPSGYYVAGAAGLCGSEWDPADANNQMNSYSDGLCRITYKNVAVGSYEFKITNGSWEKNWGIGGQDGANYVLNVKTAGDVTVVFNPTTGEITVEGAGEMNPATGDMGIAAVVVALMAAAGTVAVIGKKKEF